MRFLTTTPLKDKLTFNSNLVTGLPATKVLTLVAVNGKDVSPLVSATTSGATRLIDGAKL